MNQRIVRLLLTGVEDKTRRRKLKKWWKSLPRPAKDSVSRTLKGYINS